MQEEGIWGMQGLAGTSTRAAPPLASLAGNKGVWTRPRAAAWLAWRPVEDHLLAAYVRLASLAMSRHMKVQYILQRAFHLQAHVQPACRQQAFLRQALLHRPLEGALHHHHRHLGTVSSWFKMKTRMAPYMLLRRKFALSSCRRAGRQEPPRMLHMEYTA